MFNSLGCYVENWIEMRNSTPAQAATINHSKITVAPMNNVEMLDM